MAKINKMQTKEEPIMTKAVDCKRCNAIYHAEIKSFKKQKIKVKCPFCKKSEKIKVGEDDE